MTETQEPVTLISKDVVHALITSIITEIEMKNSLKPSLIFETILLKNSQEQSRGNYKRPNSSSRFDIYVREVDPMH